MAMEGRKCHIFIIIIPNINYHKYFNNRLISFPHWFMFCVPVKFTGTQTNKTKQEGGEKKKRASPLPHAHTQPVPSAGVRSQECLTCDHNDPGLEVWLSAAKGGVVAVWGSELLSLPALAPNMQSQTTARLFPRTLARCAQETASIRAGKTRVGDDAAPHLTDVEQHLLLRQLRPLNI